ncbi:hypothetical protein HHI36_005313 [Cryptolaemus montrouzieri]|uniref:Uncharacterized protein n=1 Tax=Cryptolaemus montrouzieri TaxID=559131 RepID=A0ABD2NU06_9CUCU
MTPMLAPKSGVVDISEFSGSQGNSDKINSSNQKPSRAPSTVKPQKSTADQSIVNDSKIGKIYSKKNPILMLYVGRVGTDVKEENVVTYLKNKFPNASFEVRMLPKGKNSDSVAFEVGADMSLSEDLNKAESWPNGILV